MPASTALNGHSGPVPLINGSTSGTKIRAAHRMRSDSSPQAGEASRADLPFTATSYPSNCLQFLRDVDGKNTSHAPIPKARLKLDIIVVGAGLGGLATAVALARRGHKVRVFEQTAQLAEVGPFLK